MNILCLCCSVTILVVMVGHMSESAPALSKKDLFAEDLEEEDLEEMVDLLLGEYLDTSVGNPHLPKHVMEAVCKECDNKDDDEKKKCKEKYMCTS